MISLDPMMMNTSALDTRRILIPELLGRYRGKVRENYDLRYVARILIATTGSAPSSVSWPRSRSRAWS